jgi:hypothetical protein
LAVTGAAAITAGVVFGAAERVPQVAGWSAVSAVGFLLLSVVFYAIASVYTRRDTASTTDVEREIKAIVSRIVLFMRLGGVAGVAAVLAFVVTVAVTVGVANEMVTVRLVFSKSALPAIQEVCPSLSTNVIVGEAIPSQIVSSSPTIELHVQEGVCGPGMTTLQVARPSVAAILEDRP